LKISVEFVVGNEGDLEAIRPLWVGLRDHHAARSVRFGETIRRRTFEARKAELLGKRGTEGELRVDRAIDL